MTEDAKLTDNLKKDIVSASYREINNQVEEMIKDLGCPRSFAEEFLRSIAENFKDEEKTVSEKSAYSSRHTSTPDNEKDAEAIVTMKEKEIREAMRKEKV
tara:strand:+ start:183 stop:482 length:300 start_codon:yes stop_codon:yes gene_type:complete